LSALEVILDWMVEHAEGFVRPPPTPEATLAALSAQGAPESLLALYRTLSQSAAGLLPSGTGEGGCVLRPAEHLLLRRVADEWPIGGGVARLFMAGEAVFADIRDGQRQKLGDTLEEALERHLEHLLTGALGWDPFAEKLVPAERLPPQSVISRIVAEVTHEPGAFELWTREILEDLLTRGRADLPGLGYLELHGSSEGALIPRSGKSRTPPLRKVLFRPGRMLSTRLELAGRSIGRPARAVQLRGLELPGGAGARLAAGVHEALAVELLARSVVDWPGLGRFCYEPKTLGGPLLFQAWPTLRRRINPEPPGSAP
jgi:hypothetical protein